VESLTQVVEKYSTFKYRIISGLLTWAATAIWATVVAGIIIFSLWKIAQQLSLSDYPVIENMLQEANVLEDSSE
jgi:hypothetical protein